MTISKVAHRAKNYARTYEDVMGQSSTTMQLGDISPYMSHSSKFWDSITDLQGRVIQQINSTLSEGINQLSLDVTEFPAGLYIYKLQTAAGSLSGKLQKQ